MYLKRNKVDKSWPVPRKGNKYLAVSKHNQSDSIPLIIVMRDLLKVVQSKKELKKIIHEKQIKINGKEIRETNYPIGLFDILTFPALGKNFKCLLSENKKIIFEEISEKDAKTKIFKILGKKILCKNMVQLNFFHGRNIITKEKAKTGDSILFNLKENKIEKIIPMEKGKNAVVIKGAHAGKTGKIEDIIERGGKSLAKIKVTDSKSKDSESIKNSINVWVKNIVVVD